MQTNIISFALSSENRKNIILTLLQYPKRQWSCSSIEEIARIPHATVFRTLQALVNYGLLKTHKINRKDILYELVSNSILGKELQRILNIEEITAKRIAHIFVKKIKRKDVVSIILYGSAVKGGLKPESDIDILIILNKHNQETEKEITDIAAELSSKHNKTIAPTIMSKAELAEEKDRQFIKSVSDNNEVLYGKKPF